MASPTAIPNANKSGHFRRPQPVATPLDLSSEIRSSEGQRLSFSPPSSFYSRASISSMTSSMSGNMSQNDASGMSPPSHHARARSYTAIGSGARPGVAGSWEDRQTRPPTFNDSAAGSQSSSYISSQDLSMLSRSPTSPGTSLSSVGTSGYSLGRVPSLPLGASYDHAQKRFNSGSWNQKVGWMNSMRSGPLSPTIGRSSIDESNTEEASQVGSMGNLMRRFSLSGNSYRANNTPAGLSRITSAPVSGDPEVPRSAVPKEIPAMRDSGVEIVETSQPIPVVQRGRQPSFSGATKRKPSPMGERLLMGHFNAH